MIAFTNLINSVIISAGRVDDELSVDTEGICDEMLSLTTFLAFASNCTIL